MRRIPQAILNARGSKPEYREQKLAGQGKKTRTTSDISMVVRMTFLRCSEMACSVSTEYTAAELIGFTMAMMDAVANSRNSRSGIKGGIFGI